MFFNVGLQIATLISSMLAGPILTPREAVLMKENIALISNDVPTHAMNIFMELFTQRPDYQQLFKNFRDVPFDQLRDDPALKKHSQKILITLAGVVEEFSHDSHALFTKFVDVAEHHIPRRVNQDNVATLQFVLGKYLKDALAGAMPHDDLSDLLSAWNKIFKIAYSAFKYVN